MPAQRNHYENRKTFRSKKCLKIFSVIEPRPDDELDPNLRVDIAAAAMVNRSSVTSPLVVAPPLAFPFTAPPPSRMRNDTTLKQSAFGRPRHTLTRDARNIRDYVPVYNISKQVLRLRAAAVSLSKYLIFLILIDRI